MEREVTLDAFERAVAGLPRLRWEARALVEGGGRSAKYRRVWVRVGCPACGADLRMTPAGDDQTELACGACDYRSSHPGVDAGEVFRTVMRAFGVPGSGGGRA
jgi:hypothetical protein